jgi:uncharacterized repeat protein (TIGR01451 family)
MPLSVVALDWELINTEGFGNTNNFSAFSVAEYQGKMYVGTHNTTDGCEIWRFDGPGPTDWTQVNDNGFGTSSNRIAFSMAVYQGLLYVGANNNTGNGLEIWTYDGADWTLVQNGTGLGDSNLKIPGAMIVFDRDLILGTGNSWTNNMAKIFRFDGTSWTQINSNAFGDLNNRQCRSLAEHDGFLYAGTSNKVDGGQVWRYDGPTPSDWTQVATDGFGVGENNQETRSLCSFDGKLYAGTANMTDGCQIWEYDGSNWVRNDPGESLYFDSTRVMITNSEELFVGTGNALGEGGTVTGAQVWRYTPADGWSQINQNGFDDPQNMAAQFFHLQDGYLWAGASNSWNRGGTVWRTEAAMPPVVGLDFGDAPDPGYPTLSLNDGAYHMLDGITFLGALADSEDDGLPNADATGDDIDWTDDEDGVSFTSTLNTGQTANVNIMASVGGALNAWIDFNADGDWLDPGEQIFFDRSLAAGVNGITFDVPADAAVGSTFARFRFSSAVGLAPNGGAPDGEVEDYEVEIVCPNPHGCFVDLGLSKDDGQDGAIPGDTVSYIITASNLGPGDAMGALVKDTVQAPLTGVVWTCTANGSAVCGNPSGSGDINELVDLPSGDSVVFTFVGTIDPTATGLLMNTATISPPSDQTELDWSNNNATDTDILVLSADLSITLDDGVTEAVPGEFTMYSINVSNAGPNPAVGAQVVDIFPQEIIWASWACDDAGGGTCSEASGNGNVETTVDLPVGASVSFSVRANIDSAATGQLTNMASVYSPARSGAGGRGDPDPSDNSDLDIDVLSPEADLGITKTNVTGIAVLDHPISYEIVVKNPGPSDVLGATVIDIFPADLTDVEWDCVGAGCTNVSGTDFIDEGVDLPAGNSVRFLATAIVGPDATSFVENTATVSCPEGVTEQNPTNNTATAGDQVYVLLFADGFETGDMGAWQ